MGKGFSVNFNRVLAMVIMISLIGLGVANLPHSVTMDYGEGIKAIEGHLVKGTEKIHLKGAWKRNYDFLNFKNTMTFQGTVAFGGKVYEIKDCIRCEHPTVYFGLLDLAGSGQNHDDLVYLSQDFKRIAISNTKNRQIIIAPASTNQEFDLIKEELLGPMPKTK